MQRALLALRNSAKCSRHLRRFPPPHFRVLPCVLGSQRLYSTATPTPEQTGHPQFHVNFHEKPLQEGLDVKASKYAYALVFLVLLAVPYAMLEESRDQEYYDEQIENLRNLEMEYLDAVRHIRLKGSDASEEEREFVEEKLSELIEQLNEMSEALLITQKALFYYQRSGYLYDLLVRCMNSNDAFLRTAAVELSTNLADVRSYAEKLIERGGLNAAYFSMMNGESDELEKTCILLRSLLHWPSTFEHAMNNMRAIETFLISADPYLERAAAIVLSHLFTSDDCIQRISQTNTIRLLQGVYERTDDLTIKEYAATALMLSKKKSTPEDLRKLESYLQMINEGVSVSLGITVGALWGTFRYWYRWNNLAVKPAFSQVLKRGGAVGLLAGAFTLSQIFLDRYTANIKSNASGTNAEEFATRAPVIQLLAIGLTQLILLRRRWAYMILASFTAAAIPLTIVHERTHVL